VPGVFDILEKWMKRWDCFVDLHIVWIIYFDYWIILIVRVPVRGIIFT
jgi:hypothetical protein